MAVMDLRARAEQLYDILHPAVQNWEWRTRSSVVVKIEAALLAVQQETMENGSHLVKRKAK